jgi:hypothetical protein
MNILNWLKTHKVWLGTALSGLIVFFTPSMNQWLSAHPQQAVTLGTLWAVAAAWAKSPKQ